MKTKTKTKTNVVPCHTPKSLPLEDPINNGVIVGESSRVEARRGKARQGKARQGKDLVVCLKDLIKAIILLSHCFLVFVCLLWS
jgi:hypothetical protein